MGNYSFMPHGRDWSVLQRELPCQGEPAVGFQGVAFDLCAAHPTAGAFSAGGLAHQGLLALMLGCDVPVLGEHGSRTEQSHC